MTQRSDGPWICTVCHKPVHKGKGYILVMDAATRCHPKQATPTWEEANPELKAKRAQAKALSAGELLGSLLPDPTIAFDVIHVQCDSELEKTCPYWIGVERASSPQEWMEWVIHLTSKRWMSKRDLGRMLHFWFSNRGLDLPHP